MLNTLQPRLLAQAGDLPALVGAWQESLELKRDAGELADNTVQSYLRGLARFLAWCADHQVPEVTPEVLRRWKADQLAQGLKPATINTWLAAARSFFAWAVENRMVGYNPTAGVPGATRKGTTKHHSREALTDSEVRLVLAQPDPATQVGKRDLAILGLMVYAGLRSVEIHRADLASLRTLQQRMILDITGKGHSEADDYVVLNPEAEALMRTWLAVRGHRSGPLFTSQSTRTLGQRLALRSLRGLVMRYFGAAGVVGEKTTHSLRHSAITKAINAKGVMGGRTLGRHKSIDTTMIYFHETTRLIDPVEDAISYDS